jgi:hypothetical protein
MPLRSLDPATAGRASSTAAVMLSALPASPSGSLATPSGRSADKARQVCQDHGQDDYQGNDDEDGQAPIPIPAPGFLACHVIDNL